MRLGIVIITALLSITALIFGYFGYPPSGYLDSTYFVLPAIHYALDHKLEVPALDPGEIGGQSRFLFYPPLYPVLLHFFISPDSSMPPPLQAFLIIAVLIAVTLALSAWFLYSIATMHGRRPDRLTAIVICAALFVLLSSSWSIGGRPEILVRLFFVIGCILAFRMQSPRPLSIALGAVLGLIAATNVLGPFLVFALIGMVFAFRYPARKAMIYTAISVIAGLFAYYVVMQLSPFSIADTVGGIYRHGTMSVGRGSLENSIRVFTSNPRALAYGAVGLLLLGLAVPAVRRLVKRGEVASPRLFFSFFALAGVYGLFALSKLRVYDIIPFIPIVFAGLVYYLAHINSSLWARRSCVALLALLVLASARHIILFPSFLRDGMTLPAARRAAEKIFIEEPKVPIVPNGWSFWALSEAYDRMSYAAVPGSQYVLIEGEELFPDLRGSDGSCVLRRDLYTHRAPKILGISLGSVMPGYSFAVYDCAK